MCVYGAPGWQVLYDGRIDEQGPPITKAIQQSLKRQALPRAKKEWLADADFQVVGAAQGAFTAKGAKQTAYLYSYNQTGHNIGINGIVVMQGQKMVAHFGYEGGWESGITRLPDITGDGLNELALHAGMTNQGYTDSSIAVLSLSPNTVRDFGVINVGKSNEGTLEKNKSTFASLIYAKPGSPPQFKEERFQLKGKGWQRMSEAAVKPEKDSFEFRDLLH